MTGFVRTVLVAVLALAPMGCGDGLGKVRGKVTAGGKPVCWGSVTLMDSQGQYFQGEIGLDGSFEIDRCPSGPMKVGVFSPNPNDSRGDRGGQTGGAVKAGGDDPRSTFLAAQPKKTAVPDKPSPAAGQWFPIPDKLSDPTTSGVSVEVRPGMEVLIELSK